jgi:pyruvate dehydrogenase E1 component beta subunit
MRGVVPEGEHLVPIGKAAVVKEGDQLTIVATAKLLTSALEAAEELSSSGISIEVVDPRTLSPLDVETIVSSVRKTSRLIILHEAVEQEGIGAEIATQVQQEAFYYLDSPIVRVAAPFAPVPASPALEKSFVPGKTEIIRAVQRLMNRQTNL